MPARSAVADILTLPLAFLSPTQATQAAALAYARGREAAGLEHQHLEASLGPVGPVPAGRADYLHYVIRPFATLGLVGEALFAAWVGEVAADRPSDPRPPAFALGWGAYFADLGPTNAPIFDAAPLDDSDPATHRRP